MNWKCDVCDTYNDESVIACYVCGQARSAASIREGKRRNKEVRKLKIHNDIYIKGHQISKGLFFLGSFISLIVIIIAMIIILYSRY